MAPDPGSPVAGSQLLDFGGTVITTSAAITVDSTSIAYVGYTNSSGNFIGEVRLSVLTSLLSLTSLLPTLVHYKFTAVLCTHA